MPISPASGSSSTLPWWTVFYWEPGQNSVVSRYIGGTSAGKGNYAWIDVQAKDKSGAISDAQSLIPTGSTIDTSHVQGPFGSQNDADNAGENRIGKVGTYPQVKTDKIPNPLSGLAAIGDFFARLSEGSTWMRVGEVGLGVLLIAVGIAKMTNAVPIATKIAGMIK